LQGTYGHLTLQSNGSYSYIADNTSAIDSAATGSHLTDSFTMTVSNGALTSNEIFMVTLDRAPTVGTQNETVAEGSSTSGTGGTGGTGALAGDSDRDGDPIQATKLDGNTINDTLSNFAGTYGHLTIGNDGFYSYVADNTAAIDAAPTGSHPIDTFTVAVDDGHGGTTNETLNFSIDRPAIAQADAISTVESATVSASTRATGLLANDSDPDTGNNTGLSMTGAVVNGSAVTLGSTATFADGSTIVIDSDGTYTYDPNHAWDFLPDASSGAPSTGTETFSYTITGGATATVTITINGQDSNDILQGTAGADTYSGGIGDDVFKMQDGGNDNVNGASGNDKFYFGASLTAADTVDGSTGSDTLVLGGDYTGGNAVVLGATTLTSVEQIDLHAGFSYDITSNDANVASGATLVVNAALLGAGDTVTFDGSAETDGHFRFGGGAGNDSFTGGAQSDSFILTLGGNDTAHGGGGNDTFTMGSAFTAADAIDGGTGDDILVLNGDYTGGNAVTMGANTMINIAVLRLTAGNSYDLTTNDANVAAGATLAVNGGTLGSGDAITFNGTAETDGSFAFLTGAGNDNLTGGGGNDRFNLSMGGNDTVHGGGGNDVFGMGGAFTAADTLDGGAGIDTLALNGDYSAGITFGSTTISNIEKITVAAGHDYNLTLNSSNVGASQTLTVDGTGLGAGDSLTFDGSAITSGGRLLLEGGAGDDDLIGGSANDTIRAGDGTNTLQGGAGSDVLTGGAGVDTFVYNFASESTGMAYDKITNIDLSVDFISLLGPIMGIDNAVTSGALNRTAAFDTELSTAIGASQLGAHHAVLFDPTTGGLHGHTFLIVDMNGTAGYQAGQDLVIDVTGATGVLSTSTFTTTLI
jgi:VCBS repeat-containing protein